MGALIVKTFVLTKFILTCFQLESQSTAYYCYIIILCLQQPCKHELVLLLALSNSYRCECHPTHNQRHMLDHIKQALKAFIKPFEALQRNVKIKISVNFFSLSGMGAEGLIVNKKYFLFSFSYYELIVHKEQINLISYSNNPITIQNIKM